MAGALFLRDAKKQGFDEGISQDIAQQKAEDEKLIAELAAQKDSELSRQAEEIAALKSRLAEALKKTN